MNNQLANELNEKGFLEPTSFEKIKAINLIKPLFSLHWEIKTILYLGVILLSGGLGILIYKNIDSIGHQVILAFIAAVCIGCYYYCLKKKQPFSINKVFSPNSFFDYILLLGCLTFITFIAYLQFKYQTFGNRFGLATFIPVPILFFTAYYFDHIGILSLAITNLAAWAGITVTPLEILHGNHFEDNNIIIMGVCFGALLVAAGFASKKNNFKAHFAFTYNNFGMHLLLISILAAMFSFSGFYFLWFLFLASATFLFYKKALIEKSFYILIVATLYTYIGISYVIIRLLMFVGNEGLGTIYLGFIYFIGSAIGLILFLIHTNKKLKTNDSI